VELGGAIELHAPFRKKPHLVALGWCRGQEIRGSKKIYVVSAKENHSSRTF
jgi:hypothetical protein